MTSVDLTTDDDKIRLYAAHLEGKTIEVSCPWWAKNRWEVVDAKTITSPDRFWYECQYRIV